MFIKELKPFLLKAFKSSDHIPIMLWSGPGIGKSSVVKQVADELGMDFIDLRLSLLNPVDLRGLPMINKEKLRAQWLFPDFLPNGDNKEAGILFLDEINLAPFTVMAAGYQLILDRKLGNYFLPPKWKIIAAGNRIEDRANITKFPAPLANRFVHITVEPNIEDWRKWAIYTKIHEAIISFLSKFPQHLYKAPQAGERCFPTPRSWDMASRLLGLNQRIDIAVGEGVASEFYAFLKVYDKLPDVDKVLKGIEKRVPKESDVLWALSTALIIRAEPKYIPILLDYCSKMPKEFEVLTIINLSNKSDEMEAALVNSPEWKNWIAKNKELIEDDSEELSSDSDNVWKGIVGSTGTSSFDTTSYGV